MKIIHQEHVILKNILQSLQSLTMLLVSAYLTNLKTLEISFTVKSTEQHAIEIEKNEEHLSKIALSDNSAKQSIDKNSKIPPSNHQINKKVVHCYGCGRQSQSWIIKYPANKKYCNYWQKQIICFSMLQK